MVRIKSQVARQALLDRRAVQEQKDVAKRTCGGKAGCIRAVTGVEGKCMVCDSRGEGATSAVACKVTEGSLNI
eukprot:scaffold201621_cov15-Tisochrysis_lutea.AAC.1